jgi:hypothetical protein
VDERLRVEKAAAERARKLATDKDGQVVVPYISDEGLFFKRSKTSGSTGAKIVITWTPRLEALIARKKKIGRRNTHYVIITQDAQPYTHDRASTAWQRAGSAPACPTATSTTCAPRR